MDRPLQQRLWGAAVLIALAVIFLPMLIKPAAPRSGAESVPLDVPAAPAGTLQELPLDTPASDAGAAVTAMPAPAAGEANRVEQPAAAAADQAQPTGDYVVEFGKWQSTDDAGQIVSALSALGLKAYSEAMPGANQWRVRIGPFTSREAAEVAKIAAGKLDTPVNAQVVALTNAPQPNPAAVASQTKPAPPVETAAGLDTPPEPVRVAAPARAPSSASAQPAPAVKPAAPPKREATSTPSIAQQPQQPQPTPAAKPTAPVATARNEPKPAPRPAAANTGYAVQLGAFSSATQAQALRDRARAAGLSAVTDAIKTDKGTLIRVRLGPVVSREAADALRAQAAAKLGVNGAVRSSP